MAWKSEAVRTEYLGSRPSSYAGRPDVEEYLHLMRVWEHEHTVRPKWVVRQTIDSHRLGVGSSYVVPNPTLRKSAEAVFEKVLRRVRSERQR